MLSKLLKYEVKATARWFLPMYAGIIIFSIINKIFISINSAYGNKLFSGDSVLQSNFPRAFLSIIQGLIMLMYIVIIVATFVLTFVIMLQRFYKNLLGDEGYLMFTLPVKSSQHIISKLLVSCLWGIISTVVTIISILILSSYRDMFHDFGFVIDRMVNAFPTEFDAMQFLILFIELIVLSLIGLLASNLMIYAAIALGHTRNSHRILYSFGAYMLINFITQIIGSLVIVFGSLNLLYVPTNSIAPPYSFLHYLMISQIVLFLLYGIGSFVLTNTILTKKLNLE